MRVRDCVTQSSLNDIDEEVAHLSGSRERTERRKNMTKKLKARVSAIVLCAAMLVTSMAVLADNFREENVPLNGGTGYASVGIYANGEYAEANSAGSTLYVDLISTSVYGGCSDPVSRSGRASVNITCASDRFDYATSTHKWTGITHTLTVYP